ncbi:hypothetical protein D3C87_1825070 [compost metagenome]
MLAVTVLPNSFLVVGIEEQPQAKTVGQIGFNPAQCLAVFFHHNRECKRITFFLLSFGTESNFQTAAQYVLDRVGIFRFERNVHILIVVDDSISEARALVLLVGFDFIHIGERRIPFGCIRHRFGRTATAEGY